MRNTPNKHLGCHHALAVAVTLASLALLLVSCGVSDNEGVASQPDASLPVATETTAEVPDASAPEETSPPDDSPDDSADDSVETSSTDTSIRRQSTPLGDERSLEDASYVFCDESIDIYIDSQSCLSLTENVIQQVDCIREPLESHFSQHFPPGSNLRETFSEAMSIAFGDPSSSIAESEAIEVVRTCLLEAGSAVVNYIDIDMSTPDEETVLKIADIAIRIYCSMAAYLFAELPIGECRSALLPEGICVTLAGTTAFGGWDPQTMLNNCRTIGDELSIAVLGIGEDSLEDVLDSLEGLLS